MVDFIIKLESREKLQELTSFILGTTNEVIFINLSLSKKRFEDKDILGGSGLVQTEFENI